MTELESQAAVVDLSAGADVLTATPSATVPTLFQVLVYLGDADDPLDGTGGDFEVRVSVGNQEIQPSPQVIAVEAGETRAAVFTAQFPAPAGASIVVSVLSPNAGDSAVAVTAYLYDVSGGLQADSFSAEALEAIAAAVYTRIAGRSAEVVSALAGDELSLHRGDLWEQPFTGLGSLAGRTRLWFSLKRNVTQEDSAAVVQITEDDGLLVVNGEAVGPEGTFSDPTLAEIVIDDEAAGDITVRIKGLVTAALSPAVGLLYDVQILDANDQPATLTHATLTITGDVTRAVTRPGD